jgi:hypothetical protein
MLLYIYSSPKISQLAPELADETKSHNEYLFYFDYFFKNYFLGFLWIES